MTVKYPPCRAATVERPDLKWRCRAERPVYTLAAVGVKTG
jgi:hypothetical protein